MGKIRGSAPRRAVVRGGVIASIAGGKSSASVKIKDSVLDKNKVLMRSKDSRVGKSRFDRAAK